VFIRSPSSGAFTLTIALLVVVVGCNAHAFAAPGAVAAQSRSERPRKKAAVPKKPRVDYSSFSHQTHTVTEKLACNSCHTMPAKNWKEVRKADAAFPDVTDFPEHTSCLSCHRAQFFARERPAPAICANCHVKNSPKDTSRWLFPSLGDVTDPTVKRRVFVSEFAVGFPHDKHIDVVGMNLPSLKNDRGWWVNASLQEKKKDTASKSCPICHETYQPQGESSEEFVTRPPKTIGDAFWLKKGTFKTAPTSHTICFTCHSADSGIAPAPSDCNTCHKLAVPLQMKADFDAALAKTMGITDQTMLGKWSRRISAGAFRHEGGEHPDLSCTGCHNVAVATFNTLDSRTLKVPVRSCGGPDGCHITATADDGGALTFEIDQKKKDPAFVCTKCHVTFGKDSIPPDHPQAIPTPKPKVKPS
jgi:hypothetical protein